MAIPSGVPMPRTVIPSTALLQVVQEKAGEQVTQDQLDAGLLELLAWVRSGPAKCKADVWLTWDDLPGDAQGILLGPLGRMMSGGSGNVVAERIGSYSVQYSDPSLFEGKLPTLLFPNEWDALAQIAGCGGSLTTVRMMGTPIIDYSDTERLLNLEVRDSRRVGDGGV